MPKIQGQGIPQGEALHGLFPTGYPLFVGWVASWFLPCNGREIEEGHFGKTTKTLSPATSTCLFEAGIFDGEADPKVNSIILHPHL